VAVKLVVKVGLLGWFRPVIFGDQPITGTSKNPTAGQPPRRTIKMPSQNSKLKNFRDQMDQEYLVSVSG
jgi:hypothetical protein